jgi:hypothetical protein
LDARGACIVAEFSEAIDERESTLSAVSADGRKVAFAEPLSPTTKLVGVSERRLQNIVRFNLPKIFLQQTGAAIVHILQEPKGEIISLVQIESTARDDEQLTGICFNSKGPQLMCRIDGTRERIRQSEVAIYIDAEFAGMASFAEARYVDNGGGRYIAFLKVDLVDLLAEKEDARVEMYFARTPIRFRKNPMIYSNGEFRSQLELQRKSASVK